MSKKRPKKAPRSSKCRQPQTKNRPYLWLHGSKCDSEGTYSALPSALHFLSSGVLGLPPILQRLRKCPCQTAFTTAAPAEEGGSEGGAAVGLLLPFRRGPQRPTECLFQGDQTEGHPLNTFDDAAGELGTRISYTWPCLCCAWAKQLGL